jgi:nickel-dependent lactate racemase
MRAKASVYYKGKPVEFHIPKGWRLLSTLELEGASRNVPFDTEKIREALRNPIQCPGISKLATSAKNVAIIVDDAARPTPAHLVLPILLEELEASGISRERVEIIIARGCHRSPTRKELEAKLGKGVLDQFKITLHNPDKELAYLGQTSRETPVWINERVIKADIRIGIGSIKSHTFAGYSGGPKIILPGVSGRETILRNHTLFKSNSSRACKLDGNPVWEDMLEAAKMANLDMKIDIVLNLRKEIVKVGAGEVKSVQRECVKVYNDLYRAKVPRLADVTVVGGYPLEVNLVQSMVATYNASMITRNGGVIILASACSKGLGGEAIYQALKRQMEPEEIAEAIGRGELSPTGGPMANRVRTIMKTKKIMVVTHGVPREKIEELGLGYASSLNEAIQKVSRKVEHPEVVVQPLALAIPSVENC